LTPRLLASRRARFLGIANIKTMAGTNVNTLLVIFLQRLAIPFVETREPRESQASPGGWVKSGTTALRSPARRWPWLQVDRLFGGQRIPPDRAAGRRVLAHALAERRQSEAGEEIDAKVPRYGSTP